MTINANRLIKLLAFIAFLAAFAVAEAWLTSAGTWPEWVAGGLALTTLADLV